MNISRDGRARLVGSWQRRVFLALLVAILMLPFTLGPALTPTAEAATSWYGVRKGVVWAGGSHHHYVEFDVNACMRSATWRVSGPQNPTLWSGPGNCVGTVRAYYSWPSNWGSPWPASAWRLTNG